MPLMRGIGFRRSTMSKYMHLTVTVVPYYPGDLEGTYPKLARYVKFFNADLAERNPSLYAIAAQVDKLLYASDGTPFRDVLLRHKDNLRNLHKSIAGNIADWNLTQADRLLYELEDAFDHLEGELA
jgi:hypothetical protein